MEEPEIFITKSEEETIALGKRLAGRFKPGDVIALQGDLGSGKTYFTKGVASAFGVDEQRVSSPTFSLIQEYDGSIPIYHFDCYRLESVREAMEIGAEEYFYGRGVCLIEWPERIIPILPDPIIWIEIKATGAQERQFIMKQKSS